MTIEQLEYRVQQIERELADLRRIVKPLGPVPSVQDTFGMFANDPEIDEIIRCAREYRQQANAEVPDAGA